LSASGRAETDAEEKGADFATEGAAAGAQEGKRDGGVAAGKDAINSAWLVEMLTQNPSPQKALQPAFSSTDVNMTLSSEEAKEVERQQLRIEKEAEAMEAMEEAVEMEDKVQQLLFRGGNSPRKGKDAAAQGEQEATSPQMAGEASSEQLCLAARSKPPPPRLAAPSRPSARTPLSPRASPSRSPRATTAMPSQRASLSPRAATPRATTRSDRVDPSLSPAAPTAATPPYILSPRSPSGAVLSAGDAKPPPPRMAAPSKAPPPPPLGAARFGQRPQTTNRSERIKWPPTGNSPQSPSGADLTAGAHRPDHTSPRSTAMGLGGIERTEEAEPEADVESPSQGGGQFKLPGSQSANAEMKRSRSFGWA